MLCKWEHASIHTLESCLMSFDLSSFFKKIKYIWLESIHVYFVNLKNNSRNTILNTLLLFITLLKALASKHSFKLS